MPQDPGTEPAGNAWFPSTCWSRILGPGGGDEPDAPGPDLDALVQAYWRPVYGWVRAQWKLSPPDAQDRTQSFFLWMLEGEFLRKADPERGRFRGFVKTALKRFMIDRDRIENAVKRGGAAQRLSLARPDDEVIDLPDDDARTPEQVLDDAWRAELVERALGTLESEFEAADKSVYFAVFRDYFLATDDEVDYRIVAERYGVSTTDVSNYLRKAKNRYRALLREAVLETVQSEDDLQAELDWLFGGRV